jgi:6-phosphogluconolactonase (cycloisomerase 2 family)
LYVATEDRIDAFSIDPTTGRLERYQNVDGGAKAPAAIAGADFEYLAVDPGERQLYAAATDAARIVAYPIAADGSISDVGSCTQGDPGTRYQGLGATSTQLYASAHQSGRIDIFPLRAEDGALQALDKAADEGGTLQVFTDCTEGTVTLAPQTSLKVGNPRALIVDGGTVYFVEREHRRIIGCPMASDGTLPECPKRKRNPAISRTQEAKSAYHQMVISTDRVLFVSVFGKGRVEAFVLGTDGALPASPRTRLRNDPLRTPVGVAVCQDTLYVAEGELNRIDAFRIGPRGFVNTKPFSHTDAIGRSFPNDVAVVPLGSGDCAS